MSHSKLLGTLGKARSYSATTESALAAFATYAAERQSEIQLWIEVAESVNNLSKLPVRPDDESKRIPAGYTYLLQFLAHDLYQHQKVTRNNNSGSVGGFVNLRRNPLMLESMYHHGPDSAPILYANADRSDTPAKGYFELSPLPQGSCPVCPENQDLDFRRLTPFATGDQKICGDGLKFARPRRAAVADARNDSHFLIAQITVAWKRFHNAVLRRLHNKPMQLPDWTDGDRNSLVVDFDTRFRMAQYVVRKSFHQILRDEIISVVCGREASEFDPAECSVFQAGLADSRAAFSTYRVFHAFPQKTYRLRGQQEFSLSQILDIGSHSGSRAQFPDWEVPWESFFDIRGHDLAENRTDFLPGASSQLKTGLNEFGFTEIETNAIDYWRASETGSYADAKFHAIFDGELPEFLNTSNKHNTFKALFQGGSVSISNEALDLLTERTPIPLILQLEACFPNEWTPAQSKKPVAAGSLGPLGAKLFAVPLLQQLQMAEALNIDSFDEADSMVVNSFSGLLGYAYNLAV